ncbi:MAG: hypothetical protein ACR2MN_03405 [Acidimicrobiales bacterium]
MINEVDEALRTLVKPDVVNGTDVEILSDASTRDWASLRNTPSSTSTSTTAARTQASVGGDLRASTRSGMVTQRKAPAPVPEAGLT